MANFNEHKQPLIVILKRARTRRRTRTRTKNENLSEQIVKMKKKKKNNNNNRKSSFKREDHYFPLHFFLASLLILIVVIFPSLVKCFFIDEKQSPRTHEWSYTDQVNWRKENKQCGLRSQSPIDIQRRYVIPSNHLKLHFYNYNQNTKFNIQNAHHTIKMNPIDLNSFGNGNDQFGIKLNPPENQNHNQNDDQSGGSVNKAPLVPDLMAVEDDVEPEYEAKTPVNSNNNSPVNKHKQHHTHTQGQNNNSNSNREQTRIKTDHHYGSSSDQHSKSHQQQNQGLDSNSIGMIDENINVEDVAQSATSSSSASLPYNGAPTIKLDWLDDGNNEYKLHDIHFHWGERRDNGSEHAIDGRRAAMEVSISIYHCS